MAKVGTSSRVAKIASRILENPRASKAAKTLAASAMTQSRNPGEKTSEKVASVASKVLQDSRYSDDVKMLAGSVLGQKE